MYDVPYAIRLPCTMCIVAYFAASGARFVWLNTPVGNGLELCLLFTSIQIAMAAPMNASTLIVETKRVIEYIRKQAEHGHSTASLLSSQASSLAEKIRTLPSIDVDQATDVLAAIEEGTWDANQIHIMVSAINASLVEGANRSVKKGNKNLQRNLHVENYLNNADWEAIGMFGASLHFVMRALSRRFRLCGIIHPSEKTFGRAASIIAHRHLRNLHPPPRLLFDLTADLKKVFHSENTVGGYPFPLQTLYLSDPRVCMAADRLAYTYGTDLPVLCEFSNETDAIASRKFCRKSSNGVKGGPQLLSVEDRPPVPALQD